ncbi:MAG: 1-deoxy-D-xylulose-5-phosphate reductoisomerase, partial [Rectinema sp.]|nr:1-deoxy-D-xylulose-5-phosphate reductoisomerase [Rectinema sp.]
FRMVPLETLARMTPDDACRHPVWKMGRKISIDSATMANKGLELIEASKLFGLSQQRIRVLIHPQSIVHAMVRTIDGALYAHMSEPDMRLPIQAALYWPKTLPCPFGTAELAGKTLEFQDPEPERYPLLNLSRRAAEQGVAACICYNASDEVAVAAFEEGKIRFTDIARIVSESLDQDWNLPVRTFEDIFELDMRARSIAAHAVEHCE